MTLKCIGLVIGLLPSQCPMKWHPQSMTTICVPKQEMRFIRLGFSSLHCFVWGGVGYSHDRDSALVMT